MGIPNWRSHILYIPQKVPAYNCTPHELFLQFSKFKAQAQRNILNEPIKISHQFGIHYSLWNRPFSQLSGGECQRIMLAIGLALSPDILLLDEPTSGLDATTSLLVESRLKQHNCIWVTHSSEQAKRVANEIYILENGFLKKKTF
ncbi:hypothetical protein HMI54_008713 [Coelomomyces lativittatus]|nr:hypothetical protein HMI54_008713 [Coelomomyces lativittatus]